MRFISVYKTDVSFSSGFKLTHSLIQRTADSSADIRDPYWVFKTSFVFLTIMFIH